MKKVLLLFTFIFCLLPNNVKAYSSNPVEKPFVCGVGYDYSYLLEYDGYEIISKSVDFFNVGTYYMTYLNKSSKETITKRIDVIDYNNIYENGYYHSNITSLTSPDYLIVDSFTLNNKTYILEIDQYNTNCRNIVITIVEDNKVSLSKIIKESVEASVNKIIVDDESIYILGTIYKEGYSIDLYLLRLDHYLNLVFEHTIGGSGIDNISDATLSGDYLYLVGNTTSSGGYFSGVRKQEDSFVMKLTKELFNVEKVVVNTLSNINSYTHITLYDENIYLCEQYSNMDNVLYNIKVYNLDLNIVSSSNFINSHALTPLKLISKNEGVFLAVYQYNYLLEKYSTRIYQINDNSQAVLYYDYTNANEENTHIIDINFNFEQLVILMYDYKDCKTKLIIKDLDEEQSTTLSVKCDEPVEFIDGCTFLTRKHKVIDYVYIKEDLNNEMFINNEIVSLSNKSSILTNKDNFGKYHNIYVYETNDLLVAYMKEEYIQVEVSVINNETFDKKFKIIFNGVGYLNGQKIESGFVIDKVGVYQLELYGHENERKVYQFEIADLSSKEILLKEKTLINSISDNITKTNNDITLLYGENINNQSTKTYSFFLLLIPLTLLLISCILLFRRKHEK